MLTLARAAGMSVLEAAATDGASMPELAAQALHRGGDLAGVEPVLDPPVSGQAVPQLRRQAVLGLAGDQRQPHVGQPGRRFDEPRRRVEQIRRDQPGGHHGQNVPS